MGYLGLSQALGSLFKVPTLSTEDVLSQNCMFMSFPTYAFAGHFRPASP